MSSFRIVTDSSCDLPSELAAQMELVVLPLTLAINGRHYKNYLDGRDIENKAFYDIMRNNTASPATSGINVAEFTSIVGEVLKAGEDVLYIGLSSELSGTFPVGVSAIQYLRARYPERKIVAVDSLCVSLGQGLLCRLCHRQKMAGATLEEVQDYAEGIKNKIVHTFMVDDIGVLRRGGRLYAKREVAGKTLNVKPLLHVDDLGRLVTFGKARGRRAAMLAIANSVENNILGASDVIIGHGGCPNDAQYMAGLLQSRGIENVTVSEIGPVVGAHSGVGTLALFYLGKER